MSSRDGAVPREDEQEAGMLNAIEVVPEVVQVELEGMNLMSLVQGCSKINMKKMGLVDRGILIHELSQGMINECRVKDTAWLKLGMFWAFMMKNKVYRYCGDHIRNANDFLRELDLGIKRRELETYAQMVGIFGRVMRERNVEIPLRKLVMIAPMCRGADTEEWVEKAISLPTQALEDEIKEAKGLPARDTCVHPEDRQEVWTRCGVCNKFLRIVSPDNGG